MPRKTVLNDLPSGWDWNDASMRPRPDAAENPVQDKTREEDHAASMRPRPDAAENQTRSGAASAVGAGFNEAAARCRGKPFPGGISRPPAHPLQ